MKYPFEVEQFKYNGFFIESSGEKAPYRASFIRWTTDPGIALCNCSDGQQRLIPSCQLIGDKSLPVQEKTNVLFGQPSKS